MNGTLYIFVIYYICLVCCTPANITDRNLTIKHLENKERHVLRKINVAIDDAINYLKQSNDSDAVEGSLYMGYLKEQLKDLQGGDNEAGVTAAMSAADNMTMNDIIQQGTDDTTQAFNSSGRRKLSILFNRKDEVLKQSILNLAKSKVKAQGKISKFGDIEVPKKVLDKLKNKQEIEKKLAIWLAQKEKERELIRQYKSKSKVRELTKEKCPDYGAKHKYTKYPCCRKCCKSSYLGCFK
ncbi:unnamed protein product [Arctia plantaginis]|uniref:Uncharacterized protein n=1 Tax=Arctia plantaginis TaxID=874455 RepID=A0A8S1AEC1_ARCPL|nr:unnamed protein product [Arctia plantaginis]CAB3247318.1 unnamed protein product [Arctia plantaginis]